MAALRLVMQLVAPSLCIVFTYGKQLSGSNMMLRASSTGETSHLSPGGGHSHSGGHSNGGGGNNFCEGTKPTQGYDNTDCTVNGTVQVHEQAGTDVTSGYSGKLAPAGTPITTPFSEAGLCPVNVHWHRGTAHRSVGQYGENGTGPEYEEEENHRPGFRCLHYSEAQTNFTDAYHWKHCHGMHVGETYEIHWPHSKGGACGTEYQYQTPFYDGVFCHAELLVPTPYESIGVQAQVFTVVNDEAFYYPDLISGMVVDGDKGVDVAMYTGSTTGTSRDNIICSQYSPITWHVDRKCHLISAPSFDKMCADMMGMADDLSGDTEPHGSRELVADSLAADQHQR